MINLLTKTLKVFFRRGDAQGIAFQESIDSSYRELYNKEQVLIINDNGSGSISKPRPAIDELIKLIEQDSVDTIYTFDRTRLFRDFFILNTLLVSANKKT
ncbi:putative site-specific integrase-resolvase [Evansella vedderi]|uniref:Site-specific integrase-resolvase n=1 Tax=Evansella vedderi TaxID=38282 RepID=A0ABT9ZRW1_9BACI|nr:recombinase family protein [Evansella vedderi]MDQ0253939.1 putative site-specific integrase-resolvase [Evansella vedderi]